MKLELKDRVYKLTRNKTPLSCIIPSRNSGNKPLLYFDEEKGVNRSLRYASNQRSPFEDEQDGNVLVSPIIFEDGMLRVPRTNPVLQEFLHYHPLNGKKFVEVDFGKDAQKQLEVMNKEVDALIEVKKMSIEQLETLGRVLFARDTSEMTTAELKRDILVFAKRNPDAFLRTISDPRLKTQAKVQLFFDNKLIAYRNKKKDVYFNLDGNKKRMTTIPFGIDPIEYLGEWFRTDEGVEVLGFLESQL
tara:strand:+ start:10427 stop:11164 length:738 start_codon:yes stop_codon:yes gene_type:complete